jgi:hypothetical protein
MSNHVYLAVGTAAILAGAALLGHRMARIWNDASARGFHEWQRIGKALQGAVAPSRYWWGTRIDAMSPDERRELLARQTATLGLSRADSERCPLCGSEIAHAWIVTASGRADVAPGPVTCGACDFRLDACRHCHHFLPGPPRGWVDLSFGQGDITFGRCGIYKSVQPVDRATGPEMARQLKARGYERISAPMPIADSMTRPDSCRAFRASRKRIQASAVSWPGTRRVALLRLLTAGTKSEANGEGDQHIQ